MIISMMVPFRLQLPYQVKPICSTSLQAVAAPPSALEDTPNSTKQRPEGVRYFEGCLQAVCVFLLFSRGRCGRILLQGSKDLHHVRECTAALGSTCSYTTQGPAPRAMDLGAQKTTQTQESHILAPRTSIRGIPETMVGRILRFRWALGGPRVSCQEFASSASDQGRDDTVRTKNRGLGLEAFHSHNHDHDRV